MQMDQDRTCVYALQLLTRSQYEHKNVVTKYANGSCLTLAYKLITLIANPSSEIYRNKFRGLKAKPRTSNPVPAQICYLNWLAITLNVKHLNASVITPTTFTPFSKWLWFVMPLALTLALTTETGLFVVLRARAVQQEFRGQFNKKNILYSHSLYVMLVKYLDEHETPCFGVVPSFIA